jgi:hypothetical protein
MMTSDPKNPDSFDVSIVEADSPNDESTAFLVSNMNG